MSISLTNFGKILCPQQYLLLFCFVLLACFFFVRLMSVFLLLYNVFHFASNWLICFTMLCLFFFVFVLVLFCFLSFFRLVWFAFIFVFYSVFSSFVCLLLYGLGQPIVRLLNHSRFSRVLKNNSVSSIRPIYCYDQLTFY